jgi:hypothetical protein
LIELLTVNNWQPDAQQWNDPNQASPNNPKRSNLYILLIEINSYLKPESKLVLMNVGLGLSPSPMSISSNLSADINPRPNFPSVPSIGFSIKNYYKSRLLESAVDHC